MDLLLPVTLSVVSAVLFGLSAHIQRFGLDDTDPLSGAFIGVLAGAVVVGLGAPFYVDAAWWTSPGTLVFALMGLFFPALGQTFQIMGVRLVGPSLTSSLGAFTPLIAVTLGVLFLGEQFGPTAALGLALMMVGFFLATYSPKGVKRGFPAWALAVPLGAALVRGIAQPGMRYAMQDVPSPIFGLLVMTSVSSVTLGLLALNNHRRGKARIGAHGKWWFLLSGLVITAGILSLNAALWFGSVTIVSPIAATAPLWTLAFGALIFKREVLGLKHLWIALLVAIGSVLVLLR